MGQNTAMASEAGKDPVSLIHGQGQATFISANDLDIGRYPGEELLSEAVSCLFSVFLLPLPHAPEYDRKRKTLLYLYPFSGTS